MTIISNQTKLTIFIKTNKQNKMNHKSSSDLTKHNTEEISQLVSYFNLPFFNSSENMFKYQIKKYNFRQSNNSHKKNVETETLNSQQMQASINKVKYYCCTKRI